jgi:biotin operon repressor
MNLTQKKILRALQEKDSAIQELHAQTGYSIGGIRGRVSELRKLGYTIVYNAKKYHLIDEEEQVCQKLQRCLKEENLLGTPVLIRQLEYYTGLTKHQLMSCFVALSKHQKLIQLTPEKVIIYP